MVKVKYEFGSLWFQRYEGGSKPLELAHIEISGFLLEEKCWEWIFKKSVCFMQNKKVIRNHLEILLCYLT